MSIPGAAERPLLRVNQIDFTRLIRIISRSILAEIEAMPKGWNFWRDGDIVKSTYPTEDEMRQQEELATARMEKRKHFRAMLFGSKQALGIIKRGIFWKIVVSLLVLWLFAFLWMNQWHYTSPNRKISSLTGRIYYFKDGAWIRVTSKTPPPQFYY